MVKYRLECEGGSLLETNEIPIVLHKIETKFKVGEETFYTFDEASNRQKEISDLVDVVPEILLEENIVGESNIDIVDVTPQPSTFFGKIINWLGV